MHFQHPYRKRAIQFMELWENDKSQWKVKVYGISSHGSYPSPGLVNRAKQVVEDKLPQPSKGEGRYGVGFMGIHEAEDGNFVFLDWWFNENELYHHAFLSSKDSPFDMEYVTPSGRAFCVWELRVLCFERQAWIDCVLSSIPKPNINQYLNCRLNEEI